MPKVPVMLDLEKKGGRTALTGRAAEALAALLIVLGISLLAMTPGIGPGVLAAYILLSCAGSLVSPLRAFVTAVAVAAVNSWVLLVEVLR